ncbi:transketolase family protein [Nanoarchaeota archaeon]
MDEKTSMRDAFIDEVYRFAKQDKEVIFVSADMGAPAFDKYRVDLADQFVTVGIAEHNMVAVAAGLAKEGKKVFTIAIAPFTTSRCHEFIKLNCGLMKIPLNIVGVGAGFGYDDSGPTHHTTEDISIMRAIPNLDILSPCDSVSAKKFAEKSYNSKNPIYIRLDRQVLPKIYSEIESFESGFKELKTGDSICIVSTGNMVHEALEISSKMELQGKKVGVIDLYQLKPLPKDLKEVLKKYKTVISLEEHILEGGLGGIIAELIVDDNLSIKLKRIGLKDYIYAYGGRENIQKICGIDIDTVIRQIENIIQESSYI